MINKCVLKLRGPVHVILLVCLNALVARATTIVMPTDRDMIIGARAIVRAKVLSVSAGLNEKTGLVCTYVKLNVREVLKGDITSREVTLKEPGGQLSDRVSAVFGAPQFAIGEQVLLYLDTWPDGSLRVHEMLLGKFSIVTDPRTNQLFAVRNTEGAHVEVLPNPNGAGSATPAAAVESASGEPITSRMEIKTYIAMVRNKLATNLARSKEFESKYYTGVPMNAEPSEYLGKLKSGGLLPQYHLFNPPMRYFEPDSGQPVTFWVNPDGAPSPQIIDDVTAAMHTWSTVPGCSLQVVNGGTISGCHGSGQSAIYFDNCDGLFGPSSGCSSILALGGFHSIDPETTRVVNGTTFSRITRSFVTFNPYAACSFGDHCNVQEITTHEMGHALGLHHSWDPNFPGSPSGTDLVATMYFIAHFDGRCGSLKSDDINAITFVYPGISGGGGGGTQVPLAISSLSPLPVGYPGNVYTQSLEASGGVIPYTWSVAAGSPPDGLTMNSDGFIFGRPATAGSFTFTAKVTDATQHSLQMDVTIPIGLGSPPTDGAQFVAQTVPASVDPGQRFNVTMVWNNIGIETWSDAAGFSLESQNPNNNMTWGGNRISLSGTTITSNRQMTLTFTAVAQVNPGPYNFQWQWSKDGVGVFGDASANVAILVRPPAPPVSVTTTALSDTSIGLPFLQQLTATGGTPPYTWSIVGGSLPPGLILDSSTGVIQGAPSAAGSFIFIARVTDSKSTSAQQQVSVKIIAQPLLIATSSIPVAVAGSSYAQQLAASGGLAPYTWTISSGGLPAGLTLGQSTGLISGTPTDKGNFSFVVSVSDQAHSTATQSLSLTVVGASSVPQLGGVKYKSSGRKLIVRGQNFDPTALLVVDEVQVADRVGGTDQIIAKPIDLGPGQHTARVVNPNGVSSNTLTFTVN